MVALFLLIPALFFFGLGLLLSVAGLYFVGRRKSWIGRNDLACFLGIVLGIFIWVVFITSIPIGGTSANNMDAFPAVLLCIFLGGSTPMAALPALMLYGPGKK